MMTPTPFPPHAPQPDGRTVRDIALHSPALVNEVWCRKILRQVLQSLDEQYTKEAPHRLIMPDTIVMLASGDAVLLPDPDAIPDFQPEIAADLRALAAVIHFAITQEMPARGPLLGRSLAGYSGSLLGAIDRCMSPNKIQRPQTVAELRDLLGMVSVGLLKPSASASFAGPTPVSMQVAPAVTPPLVHKTVDLGPPAPARKWLWIILAAVLLAAALYIVRQHGAEALVGAPAQPPKAALPAAAPTPPAPAPAVPDTPATPAPATVPDTPAAPPAATDTNTSATAPAVPATASYRLMIKPWGTVYVDGQRRGVSPPLKRITMTPGRHTVMVENPGYPDRIMQINSTRGGTGQIAHDFLASQPEPAEPAN